jgi:hypothetical protein
VPLSHARAAVPVAGQYWNGHPKNEGLRSKTAKARRVRAGSFIFRERGWLVVSAPTANEKQGH